MQELKFITAISPAAIIAELEIILFIFHTENTGIYQHALTFLVYHTFLLNQDFDSAFEQKIAQNEFLLFIQIFLEVTDFVTACLYTSRHIGRGQSHGVWKGKSKKTTVRNFYR
nr:hypothetical protein [uncultured Treponema sp.]